MSVLQGLSKMPAGVTFDYIGFGSANDSRPFSQDPPSIV